jgi:hypothetical protein
VEKVVVTPTPGRDPVKLEIVGDVALLLSAEQAENSRPASVVAGGGLEPPTYGL